MNFSGEKGIAGFERLGEAETTDGGLGREAPSSKHSQVHADSGSGAIPDSFEEDPDARGESSSPEAALAETRQRSRGLSGLFYYSHFHYTTCCANFVLGDSEFEVVIFS